MKQKKFLGLIISALIFCPLVTARSAVHHHSHITTHVAACHEVDAHHKGATKIKSTEKSTEPKINKTTAHAPASIAADKKFIPATRVVIKQDINRLFALKGSPSSLKGNQLLKMSGDANIKGKDAAILAAIIANVSSNPISQSYSKEQLIKMARGTYYMSAKNINDVNALPNSQKLFGPNGLTSNTHIIQGYEGDCFLLSAINGMLHTAPNGAQQLSNMIKPTINNPNQFIVTFPGKSPITVNLTETEIGMYSQVVNGGKWLAILSVAESNVLSKSGNPARVLIANGYAQQTLTLMTGKQYQTRHFYKMAPKEIENEIKTALKNSYPVAIQTDDHDLTIIHYNPNGNNPTVTIKNPWGTTEWYNPVTGNGSSSKNAPPGSPWYQMKGGVFTVPISAITNGFNSIVVPEGGNKTL